MSEDKRIKDALKLIDEAYEQIDKSLSNKSFERIEWGAAKGLDKLLDAKNILESEANKP